MKAGPKSQADMSPLPWKPRSRGAEQFRLFCERFIRVPRGKGARSPLRLRPWQVEMCRGLFDERTSMAVWVLPRGQGKSALSAAIALHHLFMWGEGARVMVVAQDQARAKSMLDTAARMIELNPELEARAVIYRDRIRVPGSDSEFIAVASEARAVEGADLSLLIADEIGYMPHEVWEAGVLSTGKREGTKSLAIGTPSTPVWRDKSPLWGLVVRGRANPDDSEFRLVEFGAPESLPIDDPKTWALANPAFETHEGGWLTEKALRTQFNTARELEFRRARLGQWVQQSSEAAFKAEAWRECARPGVRIPPKTPVVVALDGSKNGDSTAIVVGSISKTPHYQVGGLWNPRDHEDGWEVPILEVEDTIRDLAKRFNVREIVADPYLWQRSLQVLADEGLPVHTFANSPQRQTPATADLRGAVNAGLLTHSDEPEFNEHVLRCSVEESLRGLKLKKPSRREPIDLAVCLMMCHSRTTWLATKRTKKKVRGYK